MINVVFEDVIQLWNKYRTHLIAGALIVSALTGAGIYWYLSSISREENAQRVLSELLTEVDRAYQTPELWMELEIDAKTAWRQYKKSRFAPYFLLIQSEALVQQQKNEEALELLDVLLKDIGNKSPFYYLYKIKAATMRLASADEEQHKQGLKDLEDVAQDTHNTLKDQVMYALASYYQAHDKEEQARQWWERLAQMSDKAMEREKVSPWVRLARAYVSQDE